MIKLVEGRIYLPVYTTEDADAEECCCTIAVRTASARYAAYDVSSVTQLICEYSTMKKEKIPFGMWENFPFKDADEDSPVCYLGPEGLVSVESVNEMEKGHGTL